MRINAINTNYSTVKTRELKNKNVTSPQNEPVNIPQGMMVISFKSGNKHDVLHVIAEVEPSFKTGGVATVGKDYKTLKNVSATEHGRTVIFTPYYNGDIKYDPESGKLVTGVKPLRVPKDLPKGHPMIGKEGMPFFTTKDLSQMKIVDLLKNEGNFILLEDVAEKEMQWGMQEKAPIKLFKIPEKKANCPPNTDIFFVYTEATASMVKPYEGGGYATSSIPYANSWNGDAYAQFDKAAVELMKDIDKKIPGFDPATVICSDSQAAYVPHYLAQKNISNDEYYKGKKPTQVGHNLGDGYLGTTSARNMIVNLCDSPEQLEKLKNSKEYIEAVNAGRENEFLLKYLNKLTGGKKGSVSAFDIAIYYAKTGFVPMFSTVSEGYHDATLINKEVAPTLYEDLLVLKKLHRYMGITNALNDPAVKAYMKLGLAGYGQEHKYKLANGEDIVVKPFEVFDKTKLEDLEYVREIKRKNKINLLERFQSQFDGARFYNAKGELSTVQAAENQLRSGGHDKNHEIFGGFSSKYIDALKKGEDVKLAVSWGRGDFQKSLDTVVDAFEKYVNKTGDKNVLLLLGGDLQISPDEGQKVINKVKILSQMEKFKGRIVLMDGFAPGLPFATAADIAVLPSRFAPCELTDLEAKHKLCTPIVTNCQGMGQKNFDPDIASDRELMDGFKTKHEFYMPESEAECIREGVEKFELYIPESECLKEGGASAEARANFEKVKTKLMKEEANTCEIRLGKKMSEDELLAQIRGNDKYRKALRELRDSIISDDVAECMERALIKYREGEIAQKILKNQVNIDTTWENNGWLSKSKLSSAELYRRYHINPEAVNISKDDVLKFNFANLKDTGIGRYESTLDGKGDKPKGFWEKLWSGMKEYKKGLGITAGAVAVAGIIFAGVKNGWFSTKDETQSEKDLSLVS